MNKGKGLISYSYDHWTPLPPTYLNFKTPYFIHSKSQNIMNKQNIILDFEDFLNSYKNKNAVQPIKSFFPISLKGPLTEEYAYLIGKVMGDGNLDHSFTLRFIGKEEDLICLRDLIIDKFKINPNRFSIKRRVSKGVSYLLQVNCAFLGRILSLLGAPIGNKTKTAFRVPEWILSDNTLKRRFLQALLEDELTTIKVERCNYSVKPRLKLAKDEKLIGNLREFMEQVKWAVESFGVGCNHVSKPVQGKDTPSLELYFHINRNKKNILKFKEKIGFRFNKEKIKKLEECSRVIRSSLIK